MTDKDFKALLAKLKQESGQATPARRREIDAQIDAMALRHEGIHGPAPVNLGDHYIERRATLRRREQTIHAREQERQRQPAGIEDLI